MLANPFLSSFLDTYNLSTSSLGCKAFSMVISFLVLWSIFLGSSPFHFKNGPKYLRRVTSQVFIPLKRFLLKSFVTSRFLVLLRFSLIFSFISTCLMVSAFNIPKYLFFVFSGRSDYYLIWYFDSFRNVSFTAFHYWRSVFFYTKFHSYILTVYSHSPYLGFEFFFFLFCFWQTVWCHLCTSSSWSFLAIYWGCIRLFIS